MAALRSQVDTGSESFRQNRADMLKLIEGFRALEQRVRDTSDARKPVFEKRGQLTPRDRLAHVLDRGAPFLEISTLAGYRMHDDDGAENIMGGGFIAGIGCIAGTGSAPRPGPASAGWRNWRGRPAFRRVGFRSEAASRWRWS